MDKLTLVSLDGHAQMPPSAWPQYLDQRYHDRLDGLVRENKIYTTITRAFVNHTHHDLAYDTFDTDMAVRNGGAEGLWALKPRIEQMDREGIAAEFVHGGDFRAAGLFYQSSNTNYAMQLCQAGVKAYNRWLYDTFGSEPDRLYLISMVSAAPWRDVEEMIEELDWCADRGFKAATTPGYVGYSDQPPLSDPYWDPFWARCEERGIVLWMHAGHGERQGELGAIFHRIGAQIDPNDPDPGAAAKKLSTEMSKGKVFASVKPRRAMWQMMMGGVFDRFPNLKLTLSEIYGDWMGPTFRYLDAQYELHRDSLPAKRKPSDYWRSNCLNGLSFIRRCEVALRHDVAVETLAFGRDYPHAEGMWPNTIPWLRDALQGVPKEEALGILGGNAIRILGLDKQKLDEIAARVGPDAAAIFGEHPPVSSELLHHWDQRGQYLQDPEGETRIPEMDGLMQEDLWRSRVLA